jgi:hypothetical protein
VTSLDLLRVLALLLGDLGLELVDGGLRGNGGGKHQVDAEGLVADLLANPLDVGRDLVGRVVGLAHHGKGARVGDRRHDVLAVGEGDDGILDPERLAQLRAQRIPGHDGSPGSRVVVWVERPG